ncbi:hypothetical protein [Lentzea sp. E54]|uniref:hypothetical protein n=1 Tax=Lentzea xerophila TaxID=3435883 RepID=UPI003DA2BA6C
MNGPIGQAQRHRPSRVPFALAVTFALLLSLFTLLAAAGLFDLDDAQAGTFGVALRIVLAIVGLCCLAGAVLMVQSWPAGWILTAVGGGLTLLLPMLILPAAMVTPVDSAAGIRQAGGLLVLLVTILFGLLTMVQSLRRDTRDTVAQRRAQR